jgi:hypothetical protein
MAVGGTPRDPGEEKRISRSGQRNKPLVITVTGHTPVVNVGRIRPSTISVTGEGNPVGYRKRVVVDDTDGAKVITVTGSTAQRQVRKNETCETFSVAAAQQAMGIDWLGMKHLSQAIPPAYTFWIGTALMREVEARP